MINIKKRYQSIIQVKTITKNVIAMPVLATNFEVTVNAIDVPDNVKKLTLAVELIVCKEKFAAFVCCVVVLTRSWSAGFSEAVFSVACLSVAGFISAGLTTTGLTSTGITGSLSKWRTFF